MAEQPHDRDSCPVCIARMLSRAAITSEVHRLNAVIAEETQRAPAQVADCAAFLAEALEVLSRRTPDPAAFREAVRMMADAYAGVSPTLEVDKGKLH